ncbi:MAG: hypothetical protein HDQ88_09605 [Clostridia bacterium]|nr:hypothetical protein [Clostridia bacterium]
MKKYFVTGACCAIFVVLFAFFTMSSVQGLNRTYDANVTRLLDLQTNIEIARTQKTDETVTIVSDATNVDAELIARDMSATDNLMKQVFTWSSNREYTKARNDIMETYGLKEDSTFMTEFMPDMVVKSRDGTEYYPIDVMELNATFDKVDVQLRNVAGDKYSYFCKVTWYVRGSLGTSESTNSVFLFDTDSDGTIQNLEAYNLK